MARPPLPTWARRCTEAEALAAARRLLGPLAVVRRDTCRPLRVSQRPAAVPPALAGCTAHGAHPSDCRGAPGRPYYVVGRDQGWALVRVGVGATWGHAVAVAAFGEHRMGCRVCDGRKRCAAGLELARGADAARPPDGLVQYRVARESGLAVGVYQSLAAGIETDPATPFATVCEAHGGVVCHGSLAAALEWAPRPKSWCPTCMGEERDPNGPSGSRAPE